MKTICGNDCRECTFKDNCKGCVETNGRINLVWNSEYYVIF